MNPFDVAALHCTAVLNSVIDGQLSKVNGFAKQPRSNVLNSDSES
jgi:hypothetical protein